MFGQLSLHGRQERQKGSKSIHGHFVVLWKHKVFTYNHETFALNMPADDITITDNGFHF